VSRIRALLDGGEFVVTGEVAPPHGSDPTSMLEAAAVLAPSCHGLNVTDNQGATLHMASIVASKLLQEEGIEPIFQQTCRDRNRLALESDLLAAWALGLENVLFVTGDATRSGDHPEAKGVFDLDSTQLIEVARGMNEGVDMQGSPLEGPTDFLIGAASFPEAEPWDIQRARIESKVAAGARFFQTQAYFDTDRLARAVEATHAAGAKLIAGVLVLRSPRVVDFVNERLAGLFIPEEIGGRIKGAAVPAEAAVDLAVEQVAAARGIADGVHLMPLGLDERVPEILSRAGVG
jgi:5,10-methylenetetrahydrofolate reductase